MAENGKLWKKWWKFKKSEHESLYTSLRISDFFGYWPEGRGPVLTFFFYFGYILSIFFMIDEYLFVIFKFSYKACIILVQYSAFQLSPPKVFTFIYHKHKWETLFSMISFIEKETLSDPNAKYVPTIRKFQKFDNLFVKCFWCFYTGLDVVYIPFFWIFNVFLLDLNTIDEHDIVTYNVFNFLLPFDVMTFNGRFVNAFLQFLLLQITAVHVVAWDAVILSIVICLTGQLKALRLRCIHALDDPREELCIENLTKCHRHYLRILA